MRDKFLLILLFFLLMAAIPLGFLTRQSRTSPQEFATPDEAFDAQAASAASLCKSSFCDEAIRAVAILQRTNHAAGNDTQTTESVISEKELYSRVKAIFDSGNEILTYQNRAVGIPVTLSTDGMLCSSGEAYLCAVASPWDSFSGETAGDGVSTTGINYLCERGLSAEEALRWYLPKLTVAAQ